MAIPGKVALLGANGAIGRTLGPLLSARGTPYRVVGRSLLALQVRFHEDPLCEHYQWDPEDDASLAEACSGANTVVYLVGIALWKFKDHLPLMDRVLRASRAAGVQRFLLVSSNWSYSEASATKITEQHPRRPTTDKGEIRREQEDRVLRAHEPGVFATGVLRMADLYGPKVEASHLWSVFQAARKGTEAQVLGPVDTAHEFVFVPDAAATILQLLAQDAAWRGATAEAWNLAGPSVTTIRGMTEAIFETERKPAKYNVPGALMMRVVRAMNPYIRELSEMQYLLREAWLLDDAKLSALLGGLPKTGYAEGIRQTLAIR
ncbi:NAD-dependent epimerase/dehydratase family protein [Acidipila sp. EB88]|uniref:NAD-dependent epimerase/dehydratase family protein n=1 Tax=Acidipila sp. EB88 TaxID=2305226 RepID=UPI000F5E370E|nr:NAD-dependent epimerase/dehydratase family protein [Acidipila sp. EB88]RRA47731.1 NAD-dependent epimerase/dehydratase family protein [Acidipila sp. EB88]